MAWSFFFSTFAVIEAKELKKIKISYPAVAYKQIHIWVAPLARLAIADKEEIELVGVNGHVARGVGRLSECVDPEVAAVASCFGHWPYNQPLGATQGVNFNPFIPLNIGGMNCSPATMIITVS